MKTLVNIKTDIEVKRRAQEVAADLGLPLSTIVNAYLKELIRNREVRLSLEPKLKPEIEKLLQKASVDYRNNANVSPIFSSAKDAARYLHK